MKGPFPLQETVIDRETRRRPGAYVLIGADETPLFVGRAEDDLTGAVKTHVGNGAAAFCVQPTDTPREAYEIECLWYHTYRLPWNIAHPTGPAGKRWPCPLCGILKPGARAGRLTSRRPSETGAGRPR